MSIFVALQTGRSSSSSGIDYRDDFDMLFALDVLRGILWYFVGSESVCNAYYRYGFSEEEVKRKRKRKHYN
jgi:hypothetical protein